MRAGHYCRLHTGQKSWPMDPKPSDMSILDIAHALSNLCRFNGHCQRFYSVAEHSVLCSHLTPQEHALEALLHDATEAYCGDMVSPLKRNMPEFVQLERTIDAAIRMRFGLPKAMSPEVDLADRQMVHLEFLELMNFHPEDLADMASIENLGTVITIGCATPSEAKKAFHKRFVELGGYEHGTC